MNDIQKARDVLAKWRADGSEFKLHGGMVPLIAGLGGNSDLLDAIDGMLRDAIDDEALGNGRTPYAEVFAAAIVAADERMNT